MSLSSTQLSFMQSQTNVIQVVYRNDLFLSRLRIGHLDEVRLINILQIVKSRVKIRVLQLGRSMHRLTATFLQHFPESLRHGDLGTIKSELLREVRVRIEATHTPSSLAIPLVRILIILRAAKLSHVLFFQISINSFLPNSGLISFLF